MLCCCRRSLVASVLAELVALTLGGSALVYLLRVDIGVLVIEVLYQNVVLRLLKWCLLMVAGIGRRWLA